MKKKGFHEYNTFVGRIKLGLLFDLQKEKIVKGCAALEVRGLEEMKSGNTKYNG